MNQLFEDAVVPKGKKRCSLAQISKKFNGGPLVEEHGERNACTSLLSDLFT